MKFTKTRNEKTGQTVSIPVKYSQKGGAIWEEVEVFMLAIQFEFIKKSGAWFVFSDELVTEIEKENKKRAKEIELKQKFQGERNLWAYLADNKSLLEFLKDKFKQLI